MIFFSIILLLLICKSFQSDDIHASHDKYRYKGESFPSKYLEVEQLKPDVLDKYLAIISRSFDYFKSKSNETDVNTSLGCYLTPAIFKNLLMYHGEKISKERKEILKEIINKGLFILSHYTYKHMEKDWEDLEHRVSAFYKDDAAIVHSVGNFQRGQMTRWIKSDIALHGFVQELDEATLDRLEFVKLIASMDDYNLNIDDSDECLSRLGFIRSALDPTGGLERCKPDPYCDDVVQHGPSVAYALSHRLFNIMIRHLAKRCYITSPEEDVEHMNFLCAFMYREAVYIARRGFFARDMFVEHISLCGVLGHEEFLRDSWLRKVASWFDEYGCMIESYNFEINSTTYMISQAGDDQDRINRIRKHKADVVKWKCNHHAMILSVISLTLGVQNIIHHMPALNTNRVTDEL